MSIICSILGIHFKIAHDIEWIENKQAIEFRDIHESCSQDKNVWEHSLPSMLLKSNNPLSGDDQTSGQDWNIEVSLSLCVCSPDEIWGCSGPSYFPPCLFILLIYSYYLSLLEWGWLTDRNRVFIVEGKKKPLIWQERVPIPYHYLC